MAITPQELRNRRPEFRDLTDPQLASALERAERRISETTFPADVRDDVVALEAARLIADSPFGQQAKLQLKDGRTIYDKELERMKRSYSMGFRVP